VPLWRSLEEAVSLVLEANRELIEEDLKGAEVIHGEGRRRAQTRGSRVTTPDAERGRAGDRAIRRRR
jgi:hypothetical protein